MHLSPLRSMIFATSQFLKVLSNLNKDKEPASYITILHCIHFGPLISFCVLYKIFFFFKLATKEEEKNIYLA